MEAKIVIVALIALLCVGCGEHQYWNVKCDSGFETGRSYMTAVTEGVIRWRIDPKGSYRVREMLPGEVCIDMKED